MWTASFDDVVTRIDLQTAQAVGSVHLSLPKPVGTNYPEAFEFLPNNVVIGEGAVWVSAARENVAQIDPETTEVVRMIPTHFGASGLAVGGGSVWLSAELFGLARIDPSTGELGPTRPIEATDGRRLSSRSGRRGLCGGSVRPARSFSPSATPSDRRSSRPRSEASVQSRQLKLGGRVDQCRVEAGDHTVMFLGGEKDAAVGELVAGIGSQACEAGGRF